MGDRRIFPKSLRNASFNKDISISLDSTFNHDKHWWSILVSLTNDESGMACCMLYWRCIDHSPFAAGADLQNPSAGGQYGTKKVIQVPE